MTGRKIVKYVLALALAAAMVGCGSDLDEGEDEDPLSGGGTSIGTVLLEILYPEEAGLSDILDATAEIYEDADTALDALKAYGEANELPVAVENGVASYVTGIGGVFEKDYGDATGWVFTVNDEMVMESAADCTLSDGDKVTWEYVDFDETELE